MRSAPERALIWMLLKCKVTQVNIETLKQELAALPAEEQRKVLAFLLSLQDGQVTDYRKKMAEKIARPASEFAALEQLDQRLKLSERSR